MQCHLEDGDASGENWKDSSGRSLAPDCFWKIAMDTRFPQATNYLVWVLSGIDGNGPRSILELIRIMLTIYIIHFVSNVLCRHDVISCTN